MGTVSNFLESSSISGLAQISTSRTKLGKLFWVGFVLGSLAVTAYFTAEAFSNWTKYPIATSIETFPISGVQFPKIVVCPPEVSFSFMLAFSFLLHFVTLKTINIKISGLRIFD